jgi:hypothetical protein
VPGCWGVQLVLEATGRGACDFLGWAGPTAVLTLTGSRVVVATAVVSFLLKEASVV